MTFFWYDYETWGKNPHRDRIVQFGGLRTNEELEIIGEPIELKCQPGLDTLIGPGAVNVHGIMPEEAKGDGDPESEFAEKIHKELTREGTCSVAYNGMGFDHKFTQVLFYRNLRDPYEWAWKNGNTCWDPLELMRAAYLLQPDALKKWPKKDNGRPSFRLEDLASANLSKEEQRTPHDATADVIHMWEIAKSVRKEARTLWDYALELRNKQNIQKLMSRGEPVLHVVGGKMGTDRYCSTFLSPLGSLPQDEKLMYGFDLFYDPKPFLKPYLEWTWEEKVLAQRAILSFRSNKSPFLCKLSYVPKILSPELSLKDILDRTKLKEYDIRARHEIVQEQIVRGSENPFLHYVTQEEDQKKIQCTSFRRDPDEAIYRGFIDGPDRDLMDQVLEVLSHGEEFDWRTVQSDDPRVEPLIFRYIARNYPGFLDDLGKKRWQEYCRKRQLKDKHRIWTTADQNFMIELQIAVKARGNLDESKFEQLLMWQQDRMRELSDPNQQGQNDSG